DPPRFQYDTYWRLTAEWFGNYRECYLEAARLIPVRSPFIDRVRERTYYDHRFVAFAYHILATRYRQLHPQWAQLEFELDGVTNEERLEAHWCEWFRAETGYMRREHPEIVRNLLMAALLDDDKDVHNDAERTLIGLLLGHYQVESIEELEQEAPWEE